MATPSIQIEQAPSVQYLLRLGDTTLILGQRLSEWCGHAPVLEEDIALANIALDLIGQSRALLTRAGQLEGKGHDEDQLAAGARPVLRVGDGNERQGLYETRQQRDRTETAWGHWAPLRCRGYRASYRRSRICRTAGVCDST